MSARAKLQPTPFDTLFLDLDDPVDLAANDTILPEDPDLPAVSYDEDTEAVDYRSREIFVQCTAGSARWREGGTEPVDGAAGHILERGDGLIVTVTRGRPFWVWDVGGSAQLAISPASGAPVRETGFDQKFDAA